MSSSAARGHRSSAARRSPSGTLQHGLAILDLFTSGSQALGVGEMAQTLGKHKSTVSRTAAALSAAGYLASTDRPGRYRLGPRIVALGRIVQGGSSLGATAGPFMTVLAASTGETSHLGVLDGATARTILVVEGWHTVRMHTWVGRRTPIHCSAMGKAVLASLPEARAVEMLQGRDLVRPTEHSIQTVEELLSNLASIRERGVAFDLEELETGLCCAAAPIFDEHGAARASVSVSAPASRWGPSDIGLVGEHVKWAATQITAALEGRHPPAPWSAARTTAPDPLQWIDPASSDAHRLGLTRSPRSSA